MPPVIRSTRPGALRYSSSRGSFLLRPYPSDRRLDRSIARPTGIGANLPGWEYARSAYGCGWKKVADHGVQPATLAEGYDLKMPTCGRLCCVTARDPAL